MRNRKNLALALLLIALLMTSVAAQQPDSQNISARLAGSILINGHSMEYAQNLANNFGGRLSGSPAHQRAAQWAADQFRAVGIKNVRLETFSMLGWERGWARGRMVSPLDRPLHIESLGWTVSTPAQGVKGEVVLVDDLNEEKLKAQADRLKGKIVLLDTEKIYAQGFFPAYPSLVASYDIFTSIGVVALLNPDREANDVLNAEPGMFGGAIPALPIAQLGLEDTKLIRSLMGKGPVTIEFQYENRLPGAINVNNVVAEIPGREKADEWILIGAHLDSWDFGTGAQDNGTGCAMVLETARAIAALGQPPRRTIRFVLWGGEEQGLLGSKAYVKAHSAELGKCVAALNTDNGAGHPLGWKVEGRKDLGDAMKEISQSLVGLSGDGLSEEVTFDTDHAHFMTAGIPAFDLWVDMKHYFEIHHKASDTVDKIDAHNLAAGAAIVAITGYAIADRPEPIGAHLDHNAVEELLKKANIYDFLKASGEID
jgi:hypothetical protein